jgi:two-component sensor histidine kinase
MKDDISTPTNNGAGLVANADSRAPQARESWLIGQSEAFKAAVNGAPLEESLGILIQTAIDQVGADRCAFCIANEEGTELKHVVGLPDEYARLVDGFVTGKDSPARGLAAGTAKPLITADVKEPRWEPWTWLAQDFGYRGCWSFPVDNSEGRPVGTFAMYFAEPRDSTSEDLAFAKSLVATASIIIAQSESQSKLREVQRLQSAMLDISPVGIALVDLEGRLVITNPHMERFLPTDLIASHDAERVYRWRGWDENGTPIEPSNFPAARALRGESVVPGLEVLYLDNDGGEIWVNVAAVPLKDEKGRVTAAVTVIHNVDPVKRSTEAVALSERHQKRLLAELQHRVRNTLAVVRSIARRTAQQSEDVDAMLSHFESRLNAFSRVQAAVTRNPRKGVELRQIVDDELTAVATREGSHLRIRGPDIYLKARVAETMSLAIHELATNAIKYGALSSEKGRIRVSWEVARNGDCDELRFAWIETGLDSPPSLSHEGFGHEMLLRSLPYDLGAETSIEFKRDGMRFSMIMPVGPDTLTDPAK